MRIVVQRILSGSITVDGQIMARTEKSLAIFVGIEKDDEEKDLQLVAKKIDGLRVFEDENGKMSLSLEPSLPLLLIPQFTLLGTLNKGFRPDFTKAEAPSKAKAMYERLLKILQENYQRIIETGVFAADMKVCLEIDGPVTLLLDTRGAL